MLGGSSCVLAMLIQISQCEKNLWNFFDCGLGSSAFFLQQIQNIRSDILWLSKEFQNSFEFSYSFN